MTNYYTTTSFVIKGWPKEAVDWMVGFVEAFNEGSPADLEPWGEFGKSFAYDFISVSFKRRNNGNLFVMSDETIVIDALVDLIHAAMAKFNLPGVVSFEWAETAGRQVAGAFGGGAAVISSGGYEVMSTGLWLGNVRRRLEGKAKDMYVVVNTTRIPFPGLSSEREYPVMPGEESHTYGSLEGAVEQLVDLHFEHGHLPDTAVVYRLEQVPMELVKPLFEAKKAELKEDYLE